jgi:hypothetical protein
VPNEKDVCASDHEDTITASWQLSTSVWKSINTHSELVPRSISTFFALFLYPQTSIQETQHWIYYACASRAILLL